MGQQENRILEQIDNALSDQDTPRWAVPILLLIRDDHVLLRDHVLQHQRWAGPLRQVALAVLVAIVVSTVMMLLWGDPCVGEIIGG